MADIVKFGVAFDSRAGVAGLTAAEAKLRSTKARAAALQGQLKLLAGAAGFAGLAVAIRGVVSSLASFEKTMAEVATIADGGRHAVKGLSDQIIELSKTTPQTADQLGAGLYQTLSAGFTDAAESMEILTVASKAAVAGLTDTETAVDAITTVLNAYGKSAKDAAEVGDVLFKTVQLGKIRFPELAATIGDAATSAALVGVSMQELTAAMATMTLAGISAAESTTALNRLFLVLIRPQGEVAQKFKEMGIEVSAAAIKQKGFAALMEQINRLTEGQIDSLAELFPEIRAAKAAFILAGVGANTYKDTLLKVMQAQGSVAKGAEIMNETLINQWDILKNKISATWLGLRDIILPPINLLLDGMNQKLDEQNEKLKKNKDEWKALFDLLSAPFRLFDKFQRPDFQTQFIGGAPEPELPPPPPAARPVGIGAANIFAPEALYPFGLFLDSLKRFAATVTIGAGAVELFGDEVAKATPGLAGIFTRMAAQLDEVPRGAGAAAIFAPEMLPGLGLAGSLMHFVPYLDKAQDGMMKLEDLAASGFRNMAHLFSSFITGGIAGIADLGNAMLAMLSRIAAEAAIEGLLTKIPGMPGYVGEAAMGGIVPGPVGSPHLATVHGGEAIIPFNQRSGDTVHMNVNFNVNAIDSQDVARFFDQNKGLIAKQVASAAERSQAFRMRLR